MDSPKEPSDEVPPLEHKPHWEEHEQRDCVVVAAAGGHLDSQWREEPNCDKERSGVSRTAAAFELTGANAPEDGSHEDVQNTEEYLGSQRVDEVVDEDHVGDKRRVPVGGASVGRPAIPDMGGGIREHIVISVSVPIRGWDLIYNCRNVY